MNIYLLRHGQTNLNKFRKYKSAADKEINELGKKQAELLGKRLEKYNIDIIYSSDLKRAVQTSEIINKYINTDIIIKEELREIDMGQWDTLNMEDRFLSHEEYAKEWYKHQEDLPYPGGECGTDVCIRANRVIDEIIKSNYENIAVVTSAGTLAALISSFLGLEQCKRFNMEIENCSISILKYNRDSKMTVIKCINDSGHLECLQQEI